jgi:pimeloyl-ACP methyl ester carboxylesterase
MPQITYPIIPSRGASERRLGSDTEHRSCSTASVGLVRLRTGALQDACVRLMDGEGDGVDERPVTRFAEAPDGVSIAYQAIGDGQLDLVFPPALTLAIDLLWEEPSFVRFAKRLGGFARTVWCDYRGVGSSGGDVADSLAEEIVDADLTAVLDAAGCERVVLVGSDQAGAIAIRYATAHPERVAALVLIDTWAYYARDDDCPWGLSPDALDRYTAATRERWGTGAALEVVAPTKAGDEAFRAWWARCERMGTGVDAVVASVRTFILRDVRALLPTLRVPTLVVHRAGNRNIRVGAGRHLAEHIPNATYLELPGDDHLFFAGDADALLDAVEEFLTGGRQAPEGDVVTATILFT